MRRIVLGVILLLPLGLLHAQSEPSEPMEPLTLRFAAMVSDEPALCGETYAPVGPDEAAIGFQDFRFYISNIQLLTADGVAIPLQLEQDGLWQHEDVVLIDFEDGTGGCSEIGNAARNGDVVGMAPAGDYVGLSFDLGVPFELNHLDVTTAPSPLNIAALWWNWQGGYKFIRVDVVTDAPENSAWNIHIGSTGCDSPAGAIPPMERCARPNVPTITFETFDFENDVIVADLGGLLADIPLYDNTLMPPGCMSGMDDPDCPALFAGFGLVLDDGVCPAGDCSAQTFFRAASADEVTLIERSDTPMSMPMSDGAGGHEHGG